MTLTISKIAAGLMSAYESGESLPVVSSRYPEIDIDAAYLIQAAYVANRLAATNRVAGFKAGATTAGFWSERTPHGNLVCCRYAD